jgi:hypothetical protein
MVKTLQGELTMKNILISAALLSGLAFSSAYAQTEEPTPTICDTPDALRYPFYYPECTVIPRPTADDIASSTLPQDAPATSIDFDELMEGIQNGGGRLPDGANSDPVEPGNVEAPTEPGDGEDSTKIEGADANLTPPDTNSLTLAGDIQDDGYGRNEAVFEIDPEQFTLPGNSSSCSDNLCTATVDGVTYGPYKGTSINVSSTSYYGVKRTLIYINGALKASF